MPELHIFLDCFRKQPNKIKAGEKSSRMGFLQGKKIRKEKWKNKC